VRREEDPDENLEASMGQYLKFEEEIRCKIIDYDQCFS
jgi:hypothetical protein